ncbi:hypothetical protein [Endozoicomonas atrinae]|uniref:hypothetical protein n=1 Tax=Endozoicomonas atrinae TaxID=1333660 RepID=UPI003B0038FC
MEKAWAIIIDDDQAACMMAIPRLFEQLLALMRTVFRKLKSYGCLNWYFIFMSVTLA